VTTEGAARLLGLATGVVGGSFLAVPDSIAAKAGGSGTAPPALIVRVLGGRYLLQGAAEAIFPTRRVLAAACATDGLHAITMIAAALAWPRYRNAACASLALALTSAACTGGLLAGGRP
jgi:hypothetical protein